MREKMTFAEKAQDSSARAAAISRWPAALEAVEEKTGATKTDFCEAHDFDDTWLSHVLSGRRGVSWGMIHKFDEALQGVLGKEAYPCEQPEGQEAGKVGG